MAANEEYSRIPEDETSLSNNGLPAGDGKRCESAGAIGSINDSDDEGKFETINMWDRTNIGMYMHYAALGLCDGLMVCTAGSFCYYVWDVKDNNTCSIPSFLIQFSWSLKIFIAFACECYRPFGMRRKPYIVFGWSMAMVLMFFMAIFVDRLNFYQYVFAAATIDCFMIIADVSADGYVVQLSKELEHPERRGSILTNGQILRFSMGMVVGGFQSFLLNGPDTNPPGKGFKWGLSVSEMYWLMLGLAAPMIPALYYFKEHRALTDDNRHTLGDRFRMLWDVLHNVVVIMVMIFSLGFVVLAGSSNKVQGIIKGKILKLSMLQNGISSASNFLALSVGMFIFKKYLLNRNWRITAVSATFVQAALNLLWLVPILTSWRNSWFSIFIGTSEEIPLGVTQVLVSMPAIEVAPVNLEATTFELIISVSNAFYFLSNVVSTQLLSPYQLDEVTADNDDDAINQRMANYTYMISAINVFGGLTW